MTFVIPTSSPQQEAGFKITAHGLSIASLVGAIAFFWQASANVQQYRDKIDRIESRLMSIERHLSIGEYDVPITTGRAGK